MSHSPARGPDRGADDDVADGPESTSRPGARPRLADWLDLLALLREDEALPDEALRRRDRAIGVRVQARPDRPERWLVAWVTARRADPAASAGADTTHGLRTADAVRWGVTALVVVSFLFGASSAFTAFSFQPAGRINVVAVLGILVGLPTLLLVFAILNALPARVRGAIPLLGSGPEGGGLLQPARWALRALPQPARETLEAAFARGRSIDRTTAPVQRWLLLSISQGAAVAFQVGALAAALALVVFSDLSFGWSTTLRIEPASAHRITSVVSTPWAGPWPDAVPSLELVERSRFFRIAPKPEPGVSPALYGEWWRFVVAAIVVYAFVPRVSFFVFVRSRLRAGIARAMVDAPGAGRLLARMRAPLVETAGDADSASAAGRGDALPDTGATTWPEQAVVISWADAIPSAPSGAKGSASAADATANGPLDPPLVHTAGGRLAPRDDLETAARAAELARRTDRPIAVVVRAYEPPVLELLDFLGELRRRLGDGREIVVGLSGADRESERIWCRKLATTGDPWLRCTVAVPDDPGSMPGRPDRDEPTGGGPA